jgi:Thrombospondin type 3 repeat
MRQTIILVAVLTFSFAGLALVPNWHKKSVSSAQQLIRKPTPSASRMSSEETPTPSPTPVSSPVLPKCEKDEKKPNGGINIEDRFRASDFDCDGINDLKDNCFAVYNPNQKDRNKDGIGNACEPSKVGPSYIDSRCDDDGDGIPNIKDNCPIACNPDQKFVDINENTVNDLCDSAIPNIVFDQLCPKRIKVKPPKPPKPVTNSTLTPSPIASCSPQLTPLSEEEKNALDPNVLNNKSSVSVTVLDSAQTFTVSGRVTDVNNLGISGAFVTYSGSGQGMGIADANGNYSFSVTSGGIYTLTPVKSGFNFSPQSRTVAYIASNQTVNFTGAQAH